MLTVRFTFLGLYQREEKESKMKLLSLLIIVVTISGLSANDGQFCKLVKSCKMLDEGDLKKIGERMDKIEADLKLVKKAGKKLFEAKSLAQITRSTSRAHTQREIVIGEYFWTKL